MSSAAPPDHFALPTKPIQTGDLYLYVVTHDAATHRVRIHQAPATATAVELVFDGTYSGMYNVMVSDLRLSRSHDSSQARSFPGSYAHLRIYERILTATEIATALLVCSAATR